MTRSVSNQPAADSRADRLATSRAILFVAFLWGLGEALFFFIVPDVLLTWVATRSLRSAVKASLAALAGALIGGAALVAFAHASPDTARAFLPHIPGINARLLERVSGQVDELNLLAVLFGPLKGIPYKIYAVEWGARGGPLLPFLLISIPARWVRFALSAVIARAIARIIQPLTHHRARVEALILAIIWVAFYAFYFTRFGW
ncbi:MAG TPA: hypothetical protein VJZ91_16915 [Blastocatellia bacterium]|nr:hypothetical protein [Blastocatellia bacterium]